MEDKTHDSGTPDADAGQLQCRGNEHCQGSQQNGQEDAQQNISRAQYRLVQHAIQPLVHQTTTSNVSNGATEMTLFSGLPLVLQREVYKRALSSLMHLTIRPSIAPLGPPRLMCLNYSAFSTISSLLATSRATHHDVDTTINIAIEEELIVMIDCLDEALHAASPRRAAAKIPTRFIGNCSHIRVRMPIGFEPLANTSSYIKEDEDVVGCQDLIGVLTVNLERHKIHGKAGKSYKPWKVSHYTFEAVQAPEDYHHYMYLKHGPQHVVNWIDNTMKSFALTGNRVNDTVALRNLKAKLFGYGEFPAWAGQSRDENVTNFPWRKMNCIHAMECYVAVLDGKTPERKAKPEDLPEASRKKAFGLDELPRRRNSTGSLHKQKPVW